MKTLFVIANYYKTAFRSYFYHSLASLSAVLRGNGFDTELFLVEGRQSLNQLIKYIAKNKPNVVGFTATVITIRSIRKISREIKKNFPDIIIVSGGVHCVLNPSEVIRCKAIDAVCIGDGEYSLLNLVKKIKAKENYYHLKNFWFRKKSRIIKNHIEQPVDINKLPSPDRELFHKANLGYEIGEFYLKNEQKGGMFIFSRGCPFDCTYCSNHALKGVYGHKWYRLMMPELAIKQIVKAQNKYLYDYFHFSDDTFSLNKNWFYSFLKLYKQKIGIPFSCNLRVGTFNQDMIMTLKEAGCYMVIFGLESGNEEIRELILNRKMSNQIIIESSKWIKNAGLKLVTYNMIGLPDETPKKFLETLTLNARIRADDMKLFIFYPYKGTRLYQLCLEKKYLIGKPPQMVKERSDTILKLPSFSRKDILYFYKNRNILRYLLKPNPNKYKKIVNLFLFEALSIPPSNYTFYLRQIFGRSIMLLFNHL